MGGTANIARKSKMQTLIDAAIAEASTTILKNTIAEASTTILKNTIAGMGRLATVPDLIRSIKGTQLENGFHGMTLAELGEAISGAEVAPVKRGRPAKAKASRAPRKAAKKRGGQINTRTAEGRAQLDGMIADILKNSSEGLRSEAINAQVPADTYQIRESLKRMIAEGQVSVVGEKRATTYSWGGAAKGRSPKRKKAATKKTSRKKAASKKRGAKKKPKEPAVV